jgi:hypothetical protein
MHVQVHPEHVFVEKKRSERKKTENQRIERKRQQARDESELKKKHNKIYVECSSDERMQKAWTEDFFSFFSYFYLVSSLFFSQF